MLASLTKNFNYILNVKNLMSKSFGAEKFLPIYKFIEIILKKS